LFTGENGSEVISVDDKHESCRALVVVV